MSTINKAKHLSLLVLLGAWGCTTNQYVSRSGGGYDDLYGGNAGAGVVLRDKGADQELSRTDNPDYTYTGNNSEEGTSDYYDESYLSSRSVKRTVSNDVGYNAGFVDGYNSASAFSNSFYGGLGSYWPGYSGLSFQFGFGNSFRMRPYIGMGFGSMLGYSPWGYGSMWNYGYDPFSYYSPWGYSPWGYNSMYGYGYDSFYGGYGGYGYSPWAYSRPVIVVNNNYDRGISRTRGPRVVDASGTRRSDRYNSGYTNSPRSTTTSGDRGSRRSGDAISGDTYSSPRSSRTGRGSVADAGGRTSGESYSTRGAVDGNNVYYSRPRSANSSSYSAENGGGASYSTPRSSRGNTSSSYSTPSYSAPSRSQSDYSAPSRGNYSTPSRSSEYSAPTRTYSAPSYSAPSRSYSAPSSGGGGGGGATRSSSRGPR